MANVPKIFSTLILIVTVSLTANAENHPAKFDTFKEKKQSKDDVNLIDYRLPKTIIPDSYDITINSIDFKDFTFAGTSVILARVKESTKEIVLNAGSIDVVVQSIFENEAELKDFEAKPNKNTELYKITLSEQLKTSSVIKMTLNFNGKLRDDMIGFYKSSYYDENGNQKWLAATQFESTHARHAFPCFDEPEFKAVFKIAIQPPDSYNCLSNMDSVPDEKWCRFKESPKMSTYLVAFVISDFKADLSNNDRLKLWARPNAQPQTAYGQNIGVAILGKLSKLFDQDYYEHINKMDMVAVPDFSAGAMENWGLITYRETAGLYDKDHSSDVAQQRVASVIVHECTHMWFGNLVTPEWWSYLWLSEAFATYYQYMGTDMIVENWKMDEQFIVEQFQTAMAADSVADSKPMTRPEKDLITPEQIKTAGGTITYNKGASIVRMMEKTFGTEVFNNGLKDYIKERKLKSAKPNHLWDSLKKYADPKLNVTAIMETWTVQAGYPYITVTVEPDRVKLTQARFLLRPNNDVPKKPWAVPITFLSSSSPSAPTKPENWLNKLQDEIKRDNSKDEWLILNAQSAGFYRVNYDIKSWNKIIKLLTTGNFGIIPVVNRATIVDDLLNLARAELVDYELVFKALQYLKNETHYLPFKSALTGLDYLTRVTAEGPDYEFLKSHILSLIKNAYDKIKFDDTEGDDRLKILLRQELNNRACAFGDQSCIDKALKYFNEWKNSGTPVPKNQRSTVYCTAMRHGNDDDWDFLYKKYRETNVAAEEVTILGGLGCTEDTKILEKYLNNALSGFENSRIRNQDVASVFSGVYTASLKNAEYIIDYADKNHATLFAFHKKYEVVGSLITSALQRYPIKKLMDKVSQIIKDKENAPHIEPNLASIKKSLSFVEQEINLFNKHLPPAIDSVKESDPSIKKTDAYRLLGNVIPSHYEIYLNPHISPEEKFAFEGRVKINAKVNRTSVKKITLHTDLITISSVKVINVDDKNKPMELALENTNPGRREMYHFSDIVLKNAIVEDTNILIEIEYNGILNTEMRGFYRSSYRNSEGKLRWLAATHLEPTGARRVFPCFDEPALKATFSISVQAPDGYTAISNTKQTSNEKGLFKFETTPRMSTYLVAVVVSDFKSQTTKDDKHEYGVWANPLVIDQAKYALKVMGPITRWFEEKLGHDYSLAKMDMIALPDFTSGAMENWGLLTYRETNLLFEPTTMSSLASMQSIRNVIAHEITHQWFGDLVSPLWWDYTWLNEGFARYFQCHAYTEDEKAWNLETQFVVDHLQTSFSTDSATGTHPITHKVYSPSEIRGIFDKISYAKAASIIRMLEKLTGPTIFYKALNKYLKACEFNAGTPEALFNAFQTEIDNDKSIKQFDVTKLMNSWTLQEGFPVLNVKFEEEDAVSVEQTRFYQRPKAKREEGGTWMVPLSWATKSNPNFDDTQKFTWIQGKQQSINIQRGKDEWVIFNVQQMGYLRVNYDEKMWNLIINALNSTDYTKIHEINRANIIDDLLHLGRAGQVPYNLVLSGLSYLAHETEFAPWKAAFTGLVYLNRRFAGRQEVYDSYREFLLRLLEPSFNRLEFDDKDGDRPTDILLRQQVLNWLCNFDHEGCVKEALAQFAKEQNSKDDKYIIAPNKRSYVYCTAIKKGTDKEWNYLWQKYVKSDYATEKVAILGALACSQDPTLLNRLMNETLKENSEIRLQDAKAVFTNIVNSGLVGVETVLDYIPKYYKQIDERLGDESVAKSTLNTISKRVSTDQLLKKFGEVVEKSEQTMPGISQTLKSYNKRAKEEMTWYKEKTPKIFEWIETENIKTKTEKPENTDYRLPTSVEPESYEIFLTPNFENFTFAGTVTIDVKVQTQTSSVVLHYHGLNIEDNDIVAESKSNKRYDITSTKYNPTTQQLTLFFESMLEASTSFQLKIKFDGVLGDDMRGFYKSSYVDENKETKWLASTHFEPTYARRAFPCFDEPSFKAYFTLHISTPKAYHAISNSGSEPEKESDGERTWNHFKKSLKMSPYLLAFVVSQYEKTTDPESKRVAAWSRPQLAKYMKYAVPTGEAALKFLENFTKIEYPLDEMNFASIPDFDMGAMENWGLVTFREYGLTYDPKLTSATYKRYVNTVISHELVHQWFGNLVTCAWWDYTWLNEGFAEYVSYLISNLSEPTWKLPKQFVIKELHVGLESDSSESSHPMNNKVFTPNEAQDGFDKISYQKSASVLRMLHHSFGDAVFVDAIRSYLKARSFNYAQPEHLYSAFEERMSKETEKPGNLQTDVTTVMKSWTDQAGYPVVSAKRQKDNIVQLSQMRFLIPMNASIEQVYYHVPITYTTESEKKFDNTEPKLWLHDKPAEIEVASQAKWFIVNVQQIGFYRVNYNLENWHALIDQLNSDSFTTIPDVNRAQLIDDLFNLARAEGHGFDYGLAFNASRYLARETDYLPWAAYFSATAHLGQRLEADQEIKELYAKHVLTIIDKVYKKLSLQEDMAKDNHLDQLNRELISTQACKYGHKDCVEKARSYYTVEQTKNATSDSTITPNIATAVYCTAVEHGDDIVWDEVWEKYTNALLATDYLTILRGLGCSKNAEVLEKYLDLIIQPGSKIRRQDAGTAFSAVYTSSQVGLNTTINFFIKNIKKLHEFYGDWHDVGSLLTGLAGRIVSETHIKILETLKSNTEAEPMKSSVESALKVANSNAKWFKENSILIKTWLESNYEEPSKTNSEYTQAPRYLNIDRNYKVLESRLLKNKSLISIVLALIIVGLRNCLATLISRRKKASSSRKQKVINTGIF